MKKILFLFLFSYSSLNAQTTSFGIYFDEDHEAPFNEDRNYTLGLGVVYSSSHLKFINPMWLKTKMPRHRDSVILFNPSIAIIGSGFTPDSLYKIGVVKGDRPYACFAGIKLGTSALNLKKDVYEEDSFAAGFFGSNFARDIQTFVHCHDGNCDDVPPFRPRGWANQISNGGEFTMLYSKSKDWLITKRNVNEMRANSNFDLKLGGNLMLGYYTGAFINSTFRLGKLDPRNWIKNTQFLATTVGLELEKKKIDYFKERRSWEFYFFGNLKPGIVVWNSMLLGQFKQTNYRMKYSEMNKAILVGNFGLATYIPFKKNLSGMDLNYSINFKTADINTAFKRTHFWGSINLNFCFSK